MRDYNSFYKIDEDYNLVIDIDKFVPGNGDFDCQLKITIPLKQIKASKRRLKESDYSMYGKNIDKDHLWYNTTNRPYVKDNPQMERFLTNEAIKNRKENLFTYPNYFQ